MIPQLIFNSLVIIYMTLSSLNLLWQLSNLPEEIEKYKKHIFAAVFVNIVFISFAIYLFF